MRPDVTAWLARARADAEARGLAGLVPLLETLARSTATLRDADPALTGAAAPDDATGSTSAGPEGPAYDPNSSPAGGPNSNPASGPNSGPASGPAGTSNA